MATWLLEATSTGQLYRVKTLLDSGVDPNVRDAHGQNLLVICLRIENHVVRTRLFRYLLKKGVDHSKADTRTGRNAFLWCVYLGLLLETQVLLDATMGDLDLLKRDLEGSTALHYISTNGYVEILRLIVPYITKFRLDVDVQDSKGMTPYIYAKKLGYMDIADMLLEEAGASPHQADDQLHLSADTWAELGLKQRIRKSRQEGSFRSRKSSDSLPPLKQSLVIPVIVVTDPELVSFEVDLQAEDNPTPGRVLRDWDDRMARRRHRISRRSSPVSRSPDALGSDLDEVAAPMDKPPDYVTLPKVVPDEPDFLELLPKNGCSSIVHFKLNMASIMAVLGAQHSKSYRKPAQPPAPPPTPRDDPENDKSKKKLKKKKKTKVSSATPSSATESEKSQHSAKENRKKQSAKAKDQKSKSADKSRKTNKGN